MEIVLGIILLVLAVFLIAAILLQSSKSHKLPGTIAGGAETFFGKTKGGKLDRILGIATTVVAILFCVLVIIMYVTQETTDYSALNDLISTETTAVPSGSPELPAEETTAAEGETTAVEGETTAVEGETTAVEDTSAAEETTVA